MNPLSRFIAVVGLTLVTLLHASLAQPAEVAQGSTGRLKQQVGDLGVGAEVVLSLADESDLRGVIDRIDDDSLAIVQKDKAVRVLPYAHIRKIRLTVDRYKTSGTPDPALVRRLVRSMGVGTMVSVQTGATKFQARIHAIHEASVAFLQKEGGVPVVVAYEEVTELKPSHRRRTIVFAIVGAVAVTAAILAVLKVVLSPYESSRGI